MTPGMLGGGGGGKSGGLMGLGDRMALLGTSPEGVQGFQALLSGLASARRDEWSAMNRQLGHLTGAYDAHRLGQEERRGGYQRANEAMFGAGPQSASSQLQAAIAEIRPMLTDRSSDLSTAMENAQAAFEQEDAMRTAGTREPGKGGAYEQATANQTAADTARAEGREAGTLAQEGLGDRMLQMGERYGEGMHGAGLARMRAGMEKDVGQIRGGGHDAASAIRRWQAGQERPRFRPMGMLARAFGPGMMRGGFADAIQRRSQLHGRTV